MPPKCLKELGATSELVCGGSTEQVAAGSFIFAVMPSPRSKMGSTYLHLSCIRMGLEFVSVSKIA